MFSWLERFEIIPVYHNAQLPFIVAYPYIYYDIFNFQYNKLHLI